MNIFNTYKSHVIAAIGSLAFLGLLILLLCIKPFGDSASIDPDLADQEVPIQFPKDLGDDNSPMPPPPSPTNPQNSTEETTKETSSKEIASSADVENGPQSEDVSTVAALKDSVLIAEFKKMMDDLKKTAINDTLPKEPVKHNDFQQTQKEIADNAQNAYEDRKFYYDNYRAILSLKKVYPYVLKTKEIVNKLNKQLATIKDNREKHRLIKQTEKELFEQFEKDVRNMSTSQGKLLLKLLARETDQTAFSLIKTYKGTIPATFWYGVGLLFHENMKSQYDSIGEDAQLEKIVRKYKLGKL